MKIKHQLDMHKTYERGFSLIDVAVVMAIVGVLLAGFLATYKMYQATRATTITEENFMAAQDALGAYVSFNNKYPVPSPFGLREKTSTGSTEYGESGDASAAVTCNNSNASGKLCKGAGIGAGNEVLVGVLPFAEINLPEAQARDGYGRLFTYAVGAALTANNGAEPTYEGDPPIPTYKKHVCVKVQSLDDEGGFSTSGCDSDSARTIALVSHGSDGVGAWLPSGVQYIPCGDPDDESQNENCNFDGTFEQSMRVTTLEDSGGDEYDFQSPILVRGAGPNKNDDSIQTEIRQDANYWAMTQGAGGNPDKVASRHNYRVGIGVDNPKSAVDVNGNLQANQGILTEQVCDEKTGTCFELEALLGEKDEMDCGELGLVTAIKNNKTECVHAAQPNVHCETDEIVTGFGPNGEPVCTELVAPTCGPAHGQVVETAAPPPEQSRCLKGEDEGMAGSGMGPYTWRCAVGTKKVNCESILVMPTCGPAHGQVVATAAPPPEQSRCLQGDDEGMAGSGMGPYTWRCAAGTKKVNCASVTPTEPEPVEPPQCIDECGEPRRDGAVWCRAGNPKGKMRCSGTSVISEGCISGIGCCGAGTLQCR